MSTYLGHFEAMAEQIAHNDEALSWLMRIELHCAASWAEAYAATEAAPRLIASGVRGVTHIPSDDERDWRRAWLEVRSRKFGRVPQWSESANA